MKATVVIPAYNEEKTIAETVSGIKALGPEYQVLVVDDGSSDCTAAAARGRGAEVISHPYNKGYGAALKTGIEKAACDMVVLFDADTQHPAEHIPRMLDMMPEYDMVVGNRGKDLKTHVHRLPGKWVLSRVASLLVEHDIPDLNCGFRCLKKEKALRFFHILPNGFSFSTTITLAFFKAGLNVGFMPITSRKRTEGKSEVRYLKDGAKTLLLIARIIALFNPLKIFAPAGLIMISIGIVYAVLHLVMLEFNVPTGAGLAILFGSLLIFFGILADQISCIRRDLR